MLELFCVCLVFRPLVSVYGLFPVLVSYNYEFTRYSRCAYLVLCYPDVFIKDYYFEVPPRLRVPRFSLLCAP